MRSLTRSDHLVHARRTLFAKLVARPTHQGAVVQWREWRVGGGTARSFLSEPFPVQFDRLPRVVELPRVAHVLRRVGLHLAHHFGRFASPDPQLRHLSRPANGGDCKHTK